MESDSAEGAMLMFSQTQRSLSSTQDTDVKPSVDETDSSTQRKNPFEKAPLAKPHNSIEDDQFFVETDV
ncbi:hypothetical protein Ciccas_013220 [Cichlidogyrus casuarinus]|uniref:Uncharacterized protein n=1 Tax=Cichlidogyrus casuarinus TaxID=1844966 RepID=A0ABD2PL93_9PLAT